MSIFGVTIKKILSFNITVSTGPCIFHMQSKRRVTDHLPYGKIVRLSAYLQEINVYNRPFSVSSMTDSKSRCLPHSPFR